jgi:hypothetical protein
MGLVGSMTDLLSRTDIPFVCQNCDCGRQWFPDEAERITAYRYLEACGLSWSGREKPGGLGRTQDHLAVIGTIKTGVSRYHRQMVDAREDFTIFTERFMRLLNVWTIDRDLLSGRYRPTVAATSDNNPFPDSRRCFCCTASSIA